ncbi:MAG: ABC transporter permease, partial [Enterococcus sp.]|nr:ABC transporter permease [Enterococcus sp.]
MLKYIGKRILLMIPVLLGVSLIIFSIMYLTPGEPAQILLGDAATQEQIEILNKQLGYDKPFFEQYVRYIMGIVTKFDFGNSFRTNIPVTQEILNRTSVSIKTAIFAMIGASLI